MGEPREIPMRPGERREKCPTCGVTLTLWVSKSRPEAERRALQELIDNGGPLECPFCKPKEAGC